MLEKTLELLRGVQPGQYVPEGVECYDDQEITRLAQAINRLMYAPSQIRKRLQELGVTITPANFYSEIPLVKDIEDPSNSSVSGFGAVFDSGRMLRFLDELSRYSGEFNPPVRLEDPASPSEFAWEGGPFSFSDAMSYYTVIRHLKPRRIIEIGSGWSTLVAGAACERNGFGEIICIEPFPAPFLAGIGAVVKIIDKTVQHLDINFFNEMLDEGSILFIDSTHTVKHGSDCIHLYLRVLPNLIRTVTIHAHDIYLPSSMPMEIARDKQLYWTEQYLLYAYLLENRRTEVLYGSKYHFLNNRDRLKTFMHGRYPEGGASFWFSQAGSDARP